MNDSFSRWAFRRFKEHETRKHELNYIFWECTTRCNLNCLHCGSDCAKDSEYRDMPMEDFLVALDTIPQPAPHAIVVITGGEPLLRRDLAECGMAIRKRGYRWSMVTNGFLYDEAKQNELLCAGLGALTLSLDGIGETHNWLRNSPRSFERVDRAISLAAGVERLNFDVVTCVNSRNFAELPAIRDYLIGKGVKLWRLFTIIPIGRATQNPEMFIDDEQFTSMLEFIEATRKEGRIKANFSCEGFVGAYETKVRDSRFFCRAGINIGSVLIDGSICACPNIDRTLAQGNIYKDNFYSIWQNAFSPFRDRSWTKTGICRDCDMYKDCLGNGLHYRHGDRQQPLVCHMHKIIPGHIPSEPSR